MLRSYLSSSLLLANRVLSLVSLRKVMEEYLQPSPVISRSDLYSTQKPHLVQFRGPHTFPVKIKLNFLFPCGIRSFTKMSIFWFSKF